MNILCTIGDCNGIGLEVFFKALRGLSSIAHREISVTLCGNSRTIADYALKLGEEIHIHHDSITIGSSTVPILECESYAAVRLGESTASAARLAIESLEKGITHTLSGEYDAIVTLPISKVNLKQVGWNFPGQTEMLATRCHASHPMMILCSDTVRVALATIHIPLKNVPGEINQHLVYERITSFHESLARDYALPKPSIAVLGLNPHAGEQGEIGQEEIEAIHPAISEAQHCGINAQGTFPADGFFAHGEYKAYDGILAMYHDQGLIPLKMLASLRSDLGPNLIARESVQRRIVITANVAGRDLRSIITELRGTVEQKVHLPTGYYVAYGGQFESEQAATRTLALLGSGVVIGIFLLLYLAFRSTRRALLVMVNLPFALIGGVAAVWISGSVLNVASLVGFITLFGIATRNGIMMVSHYMHLLTVEKIPLEEAVVRGSQERLSPVLMTALCAGLALVPLVLAGARPGNELQAPMGVVILGGLLSSTALNMLVVPSLFLKYGGGAE